MIKKIITLLLSTTSLASVAVANLFYLQQNIAVNDSWANPAVWFDQTSGGGNNPALFGDSHFDTNGFTPRTGDGDNATTTFNGASLTLRNTLFQPQAAVVNIPNRLIVTGGNSLRVHNSRTAVEFNVGTLELDSNYLFRSPLSTHSLTSNIGVLVGSANLTFNNSTELGVHTLNVGDASAYTGEIRLNNSSLTFAGPGNVFLNASLFLPNNSVSLVLAGNVTFGGLSGIGFADLAPNTYDASALNAWIGDPVFSGDGNLTVVPEPSTYALLLALLALGLVVARNRRRS
jgi:hypothetical protein